MLTFLLARAALAAWVAMLVVAVRAAFVGLSRDHRPRTEDADGLHDRVSHLEIAVAGLPSLWETERQRIEEERERADRAYAKARAAESRANRLMEEREDESDPGQGVLPFDGAGSDQRGVYSMPIGMGQGQPDARRNELLPYLLKRR